MFSGIVEEIGTIAAVSDADGGRQLKITAAVVTADLKLGDSVAVSGACLTACQLGKNWFAVEATYETLRRTKLGKLKKGDRVNLERALKVSDRLGGHIVSGHVDGLGQVKSIKQEGFSKIIEFCAPGELSAFFVEKGSVTIDGVSLTVAHLKGDSGNASSGTLDGVVVFDVALIPHTLEKTTLGWLKAGDGVNIEADIIGKYVARLLAPAYEQNINKASLSLPFLAEHGYT